MFAVVFASTFCDGVGVGVGVGWASLPPLSVFAFHLSNANEPRNTKTISFAPFTFLTLAVKSLKEPLVFETLIVPSNVPDCEPSLTSMLPFPPLWTVAVIDLTPLENCTPLTFVKSPLLISVTHAEPSPLPRTLIPACVNIVSACTHSYGFTEGFIGTPDIVCLIVWILPPETLTLSIWVVL